MLEEVILKMVVIMVMILQVTVVNLGDIDEILENDSRGDYRNWPHFLYYEAETEVEVMVGIPRFSFKKLIVV